MSDNTIYKFIIAERNYFSIDGVPSEWKPVYYSVDLPSLDFYYDNQPESKLLDYIEVGIFANRTGWQDRNPRYLRTGDKCPRPQLIGAALSGIVNAMNSDYSLNVKR